MKLLLSSIALFGSLAIPTIALAVTASDPGSSPNDVALEPYLITWLLPVAGALSAVVMIFVDRRTRTMR